MRLLAPTSLIRRSAALHSLISPSLSPDGAVRLYSVLLIAKPRNGRPKQPHLHGALAVVKFASLSPEKLKETHMQCRSHYSGFRCGRKLG
ncbi:hypothetical protein BX600DRAFT_294325 [Xylariales sp. PMI_506]|nr:hypothetical protein BX600DRAFT_294325 [Xylariales sp. PMI_506]